MKRLRPFPPSHRPPQGNLLSSSASNGRSGQQVQFPSFPFFLVNCGWNCATPFSALSTSVLVKLTEISLFFPLFFCTARSAYQLTPLAAGGFVSQRFHSLLFFPVDLYILILIRCCCLDPPPFLPPGYCRVATKPAASGFCVLVQTGVKFFLFPPLAHLGSCQKTMVSFPPSLEACTGHRRIDARGLLVSSFPADLLIPFPLIYSVLESVNGGRPVFPLSFFFFLLLFGVERRPQGPHRTNPFRIFPSLAFPAARGR